MFHLTHAVTQQEAIAVHLLKYIRFLCAFHLVLMGSARSQMYASIIQIGVELDALIVSISHSWSSYSLYSTVC